MDVVVPNVPGDVTSFRWESDLVDAVLDARGVFASSSRKSRLTDYRLEVPTTSGVPDIMLVEWDEDAIADRHARSLAPVADFTRVRVLEFVQRGPTDIDSMSVAAGVSRAYLRRSVLPALEELGWLRRLPDHSYSLVEGVAYRSPVSTLVTVEAKLTDWRRAFKQAALHALTADQAYMALDARHAAGAVAFADEFAREGVGVATVDAATRSVRVVSRPPTRRRWRDARFRFAAEQAWSLRREGRTSGNVGQVFGRDLAALRTAV